MYSYLFAYAIDLPAGAKTLLIERFGILGGMMNVSGPPGWAFSHLWNNHGQQIAAGIIEETHHRLEKQGHAFPYPAPEDRAFNSFAFIDPDWWGLMIFEMMTENHVELLLHSLAVDYVMEGNTVKGVVVENTAGRQVVRLEGRRVQGRAVLVTKGEEKMWEMSLAMSTRSRLVPWMSFTWPLRTASGRKPSFSNAILPGAETPNRSRLMTAGAYLSQPCPTPASTASLALTCGGSTASRYAGSWRSNNSQEGKETTRTSMPAAWSCSAAAWISPTSEPEAIRIKPGSGPKSLST